MTIPPSGSSSKDDDALLLLFQPQVRVSDGMTVGNEALLRARRAADGSLLTARTILARTEAGNSHETRTTSAWILNEACQTAQQWRTSGCEQPVSVNVSAREVQDTEFASTVETALQKSGLPPLC